MQTLDNYKKAKAELATINKLIKDEIWVFGFNIDLRAGGNKDNELLTHTELSFASGVAKEMILLLKQALEANLKFWKDTLEREILDAQQELLK